MVLIVFILFVDSKTPSQPIKEPHKFTTSKSQHAFDEVPAIVEVPMASFEQDLEDDEYLPELSSTQQQQQQQKQQQPTGEEWTCKKCTLVNSYRVKACIVCGGSKLKSISAVEDMTLRKGEFWSCAQCTLKNSLSTSTCIACKAIRQIPVISGQQTNFRPYTSSPVQPNQKSSYHHRPSVLATIPSNTTAASNTTSNANVTNLAVASNGSSSIVNNSLAPPAHRVSRSPSPKHDRAASGAIPKVFIPSTTTKNIFII